MEGNGEERKRLEYRKGRLEDKLSMLERTISGRDVRVPPLVRGPDGAYDEERAWQLVEGLMACLDGAWREEDRVRGEALCRSLFYCLLRMAENFPHWVTFHPLPARAATDSFQAVVTMAQRAGETMAQRLYGQPWILPGDLCASFLEEAYMALRGRQIWEEIPGETFQALLDRYGTPDPDSPELTEEELREVLAQDRALMLELDMVEEGPEELDTQAWKESWAEGFPCQEAFCRACRQVWILSMENRLRSQLPRLAERAVDLLLYRRGLSAFLDDDTFFYTYALVDKVVRQVREKRKAGGC